MQGACVQGDTDGVQGDTDGGDVWGAPPRDEYPNAPTRLRILGKLIPNKTIYCLLELNMLNQYIYIVDWNSHAVVKCNARLR